MITVPAAAAIVLEINFLLFISILLLISVKINLLKILKIKIREAASERSKLLFYTYLTNY